MLQVLESELARVAALSVAQPTPVPAVKNARGRLSCVRCGQTAFATLPSGARYCLSCVGMGRVTTGARLWRVPLAGVPQAGPLTWAGTLTPAQAQAAAAVQTSVAAGRDHLLWAVTGAGKTEMLFPVIADALAAGQRVAVVSPRIDVVRELAPRLSAAFAGTPMTVLYGGLPWPGENAALVVATSHQMLRFYRHFGLMIIDEVDAFPFSQTPALAYACRQATDGPTVYLSATPPTNLRRQAARGQLARSFLPRRFHQHSLPVPRILRVATAGLPGRVPQALWRCLAQARAADRRALVFVPDTRWVAPLAAAARAQGFAARGVHASDPAREATVQAFRDHTFAVLVTTSILERGVTIPRCAVIVLAAERAQFPASALVQMAGRAGRAAASPNDPVWYLAGHFTWAMAQALHEIRVMNRRGQP
ncbi:helicase-related protein [Lacticaseibacillus kribbianus]|uniref:helicase-related protein n=1 Tax=Lacticaseibacillus kribbianus TaxID=2926292 RepID=UPI001CD8160D|nr:helicase-related protein [Lacticaseibacillus kribbianus]